MKRVFCLWSLIGLLELSPNAGVAIAANLGAADQREVDQVGAYLRTLPPMEGRFSQTDSRGARSGGAFVLQAGGRARFDYDPPSRLLLLADGRRLWIIDRRLGTTHDTPIAHTPLAALLSRDFSSTGAFDILRVKEAAGELSLTAVDHRHPRQGAITLVFSQSPIALRGWSLADARGGAVSVRLEAVSPAHPHGDADFHPKPGESRQGG